MEYQKSQADLRREHPTVFHLWNVLFTVRVPSSALISEEELRMFGKPHTGVPYIDNAAKYELTTTSMSIVKMVELRVKNGTEIYIVNPNDVDRIYNYIQDHLILWAEKMSLSLNASSPPSEDLLALNAFANEIYPYTSHFKNSGKQDATTTFGRYLDSIGAIHKDDLFGTGQKAAQTIEKHYKQREDLSNVFKNIDKGARKKWR